MYTETNKGFTIITNFGCDQNCPYCISKYHPILRGNLTDKSKIDYDKIEELVSNSDAPTINLSGGGDPFYNWESNQDFYSRIYEIARRHNKLLDVHTRILPSTELLSKFRKIGLSVEYWNQSAIDNLKLRFDEISKVTKIRVIQVLNGSMTRDQIMTYIDIIKSIGVEQITFRQMFGNRKAYEHFNELKDYNWGSGVMFLPDGEYHNYYFTTNNEYYPYFFGYSESDRNNWMKKYENIEQNCN